MDYDKLHTDAKRAADAGQSLEEACPWPFASAEGRRYKEIFIMHKAARLALGLDDKALTSD